MKLLRISKIDKIIKQKIGDIKNPNQFVKDLKSPKNLIQNSPFVIVNRTNSTLEKVTIWDPHIAIVVDDKTRIISQNTVISNQLEFWKIIPLELNKLNNQIQHSVLFEYRTYLGFYGYIAFEVSRLIEKYEYRTDSLSYPYLVLIFPNQLLIDRNKELVYIDLELSTTSLPKYNLKENNLAANKINHGTDLNSYIKNVDRILKYIKNGDIYQANYTQQFSVKHRISDLLELFNSIQNKQQKLNAAFMSLNGFSILSLSPELFLRIENGTVITRPIKGTRPRGNTPEEDEVMVEELKKSTKDHAELSMIVDLLRNDLGKTSHAGTVRVDEHAIVESYENVHHLVSTISSKINANLFDSWALLIRAFPGGSISGVPKLRSLEIIEESENLPRGAYTGNIGFLSINGDMEFNIAIRTAVVTSSIAVFNAGGGIVWDSDPIDEYIESLHKAKHLARYFNHNFIGHLIWRNGNFLESEGFNFPLLNEGCFETILVENGKIRNFQLHMERLRVGLLYFNINENNLPKLDEITQFLKLNLVETARLNIFAYSDSTIIMSVNPYEIPDSITSISLLMDSKPSQIPITIAEGIKSVDYDLYKDKTSSATSEGYWDAILIDDDNKILEGGRSTIYVYTDKWITPKNNVVHGTIRSLAIRTGLVNVQDFRKSILNEVNAVATSNALSGIMNVSSIYSNDKEIWKENNTSSRHVRDLKVAVSALYTFNTI